MTKKADVIDWLKRSLAAVKTARAQLKPGDLERKVKIEGKTVTVDGMYLRIIIHDNEHMGQLVAYARMNGIVPPWSKPSGRSSKERLHTLKHIAILGSTGSIGTSTLSIVASYPERFRVASLAAGQQC